MGEAVGKAVGVQERLTDFVREVTANLGHVRRPENALTYVRGLLEQGGRKSLQPTMFRLEETPARYESMQQFLADSPWEPGQLLRALATRVVPEIGLLAWVVDDTGIPKCGRHSPGVKRQYSGTLGKIGNCQITVSLHAVGLRGTLPLGWALYLPEDWTSDPDRRRQAKIPTEVSFKTKPELAYELCAEAASWELPTGPVLIDAAYGNDSAFRSKLAALGLTYVAAVQVETTVYGPETTFTLPEGEARRGRPRSLPVPDREPESVRDLALGLPEAAFKTLACRTTPGGKEIESRFAFLRVVAAHPVLRARQEPRWEWLIIEWPEGESVPTDCWLSNLPEDEPLERLCRLARLRWTIELDYRQLKGELGLDHYEGRSYAGFHHHCALVTCAHAFLTLERLDPKVRRPV